MHITSQNSVCLWGWHYFSGNIYSLMHKLSKEEGGKIIPTVQEFHCRFLYSPSPASTYTTQRVSEGAKKIWNYTPSKPQGTRARLPGSRRRAWAGAPSPWPLLPNSGASTAAIPSAAVENQHLDFNSFQSQDHLANKNEDGGLQSSREGFMQRHREIF